MVRFEVLACHDLSKLTVFQLPRLVTDQLPSRFVEIPQYRLEPASSRQVLDNPMHSTWPLKVGMVVPTKGLPKMQ